MKIKLTLIIAMLALASFANGAIYTFNNVALGAGSPSSPGDTLYANSSGALSLGSIVSVGYFTSGFSLTGINLNKTDLLANYTILSSVVAGSTTPSFENPATTLWSGYTEYAGIDTANITGADSRIGLVLYAFSGNAATLATSSNFSLFQVSVIADDVPSEQEYVVNPAGIAPIIGTAGTFTGASAGGTGTYGTLQTALIPLVAVPEPSAALLGALGALGLLRRRRN